MKPVEMWWVCIVEASHMVLPAMTFIDTLETPLFGVINEQQLSSDVALGKQSITFTKYVWGLQYFHLFSFLYKNLHLIPDNLFCN